MLLMDVFTGITTALAGLKTASDLATGMRKALAEHELKLEEVPGKIMEIQGVIIDSRTALGDSEDTLRAKNKQIHQLEIENAELKAQLTKKAQARKHDNAIWKALEGDTEDGPYCPNCWEQKGHFIQPKRAATNADYFNFFCDEHGARPFSFQVPAALCDQRFVTVKKPARPAPQPHSPWS
jgi:hypothetical protein